MLVHIIAPVKEAHSLKRPHEYDRRESIEWFAASSAVERRRIRDNLILLLFRFVWEASLCVLGLVGEHYMSLD